MPNKIKKQKTYNRINKESYAEIVNLYVNEFERTPIIAEKFNTTERSIIRLLNRLGVDTSKRKYPVSCSACGKTLYRSRGRIRKNNNHYCDYTCLSAGLLANSDYKRRGRGVQIARQIVSEYFELSEGNVVHHIDGNNYHNNITNLMVFKNQGDHVRYHRGFKDMVVPLFDGRNIKKSA